MEDTTNNAVPVPRAAMTLQPSQLPILVTAAIGIVTLCLVLFRRHRGSASLPPLPPEGPSFSEFMGALKDKTSADLLIPWVARYGDVFTVKLPNALLVFVADPPAVKDLTVRQANMYRDPSRFTTRSPAFAAATRAAVGTSVTGLVGEGWRWRKDALIREFHRNRMLADERGLLGRMVEEGLGLLRALEGAAESGEVVEVDALTTRAAVGVVLHFLFGRVPDFDPESLRDAAKFMLDYLGHRLANPHHHMLKRLPFGTCRDMERRKEEAWRVMDSVIEEEIRLLIAENEGHEPVASDRKPGSVIASLIANEPRFRVGGVESMIAEARVFVQAGFETTAHALAFSFGMMAEHPKLADELAEEGRRALGASFSDEDLSHDAVQVALERSTTVRNFFLEAVRLYPLAPALGGVCTDDITLTTSKGEKYGLPKGTTVNFPNLALQRHTMYARGSGDPNSVEPDRWDAKPTEQPFLHTFNNGPHVCPGRPLSVLEGHVFLLLVVTRFEFEFPNGGSGKVEYSDDILLRPKGGMPLVIKRRK